MGMTLTGLTARLAVELVYTDLFKRAFGDPAMTSKRIAQFVRAIVSYQTKYDQGVLVNFSNFTPQEALGRQVFLGQVGRATCTACHGSDNFVPGNLNNNGIENPSIDLGVGGVTGVPGDIGKFKISSLRNIALTAPYMHDGRFATLGQVVEFYNSGVTANPNLSVRSARQLPGHRSEKPRRVESSAGGVGSGNDLLISTRDREQERAADSGFLAERGRNDVVRL